MWKRDARHRENWAGAGALDVLHRCVLGLPWVVERPPALEIHGVRTFAVDCEPLGIRQLWLVTGHAYGRGIAVVVPAPLGDAFEANGRLRVVAPMPAEHVFARVPDDATCAEIERVVAAAYASAMRER